MSLTPHYLRPTTYYLLPTAFHVLLIVFFLNLQLTFYHLLPTFCYSLFATYYLLATHNLLLAIYHLPPTTVTCYPLLGPLLPTYSLPLLCSPCTAYYLPVVPRKAVAEVSKIGNL